MKLKVSTQTSRKLCESLSRLLPAHKEELRKLYKAPLGLTFELEPTKAKQTESQRGYYWRSTKIAGDALGMSQDELHLVVKREAFGFEIIETPLGHIERIKSSADAKRDEYSVLIETLIRLCAFAGHVVEPAERMRA